VEAESERASSTVIATARLGLCLDFANTLAGRGSVRAESLHSLSDLIGWGLAGNLIAQGAAAALLNWSRGNPARADSVFAEAIALREAIYGIFGHLAAGCEVEETDLNCLNRALTEAPGRCLVAPAGTGFGWRIESSPTSAVNILAPVVWSAGDLLTGRHLERVRVCANHQCLWLFYDDSLRGARRWCSMQVCGNRAKTQRHYLRCKGA